MKKILAFTLAETLIVMGIIGIVSALTLPNLNSSTGEKEKVAKVKKLYQNLDDAIGRAQAVYGPVDEWKSLDSTLASQSTRFGDRLTEFMKVSKNCGFSTNQGCFAKKTTYLNGNNAEYSDSMERYKFILADGTSAQVITGTLGIVIDIDGPSKGKNKFGVDLFCFVLGDNNTTYYPNGNGGTSTVANNLKPNEKGVLASTWVINYDNMDYLKLTSEGKCPNGKVLDGTTNTTCK